VIACLDSSVLLRAVLGQRGRLKEWRAVREGVFSALAEVESLQTLAPGTLRTIFRQACRFVPEEDLRPLFFRVG